MVILTQFDCRYFIE